MKTTAFLCLILLPFSIFSQATSGGPDAFGYTYKSSLHASGPTYQWFDISSTGSIVSGLADDNFVGPFTISGFQYYSTSPTQLYIGSNGFISFNPVNISSTNAQFPAIPTIGGPNDFIAPMLSDLTFGGASTNPAIAYYYNQGDTICVTFEQVPFWNSNVNQYAGDNSFQVILNKADSSITFNYKKQLGLPDLSYTVNYLSIGIENGTGSDGLQYHRGIVFPGPNTSIKFEYPSIVQALTDAEVSYVDNDKNGAIFVSQNDSYTPISSVKNTGNQDISSQINVFTRIFNSNGVMVYNSSTHIDSLASGDDSLVTFNAYTAFAPGKYSVQCFVDQVPNDLTVSNDSNSIIMRVVDTTSLTQTLDYSNGVNNFGLAWNGGNAGIGVYIEPPYYPAKIVSSNFYITATGSTFGGFHSIIYDDNGRGPGKGTILDSSFVAAFGIIGNSYANVPTTNNVVITSGGVYLEWRMGGPAINIGRSFVAPASNRSYEIIFGAWSDYRDKATQDFLMNIEIEPVGITVGTNKLTINSDLVSLYPNPSSENLTVEINETIDTRNIQILDIKGRIIDMKFLRYTDKIILVRGRLKAGTYFLRIGKQVQQFILVD